MLNTVQIIIHRIEKMSMREIKNSMAKNKEHLNKNVSL